ncbi:MAG: hypothetical protein LQ345_003640 [Seirophora villosa]|nr:MAG: hypothetical protein LQ345_003640 [Seirophora villosa]
MAKKPVQLSYYFQSRSNPAVQQPAPGFQFTKPIRKIIEPPILDTLRALHHKQSGLTSSTDPLQLHEVNVEKEFLHYRPGSEFQGQKEQRLPLITSHPVRDIFYVPPIKGYKDRHPEPAKVLPSSNKLSQSETLMSPYQWISTPWFRLGKQYLRSQPFKRISLTTQQQEPSFSTSTARPAGAAAAPEPLDIDRYHRLADTYIDNLVAKLEEIQEERDDVDCEYSAGVLTLTFPPAGTYVLNKQPPNKQIWLSSPISGPKRYDYVGGSDPTPSSDELGGGDGASRGGAGVVDEERKGGWVYLRDGSTLSGLLREELGVELEPADLG